MLGLSTGFSGLPDDSASGDAPPSTKLHCLGSEDSPCKADDFHVPFDPQEVLLGVDGRMNGCGDPPSEESMRELLIRIQTRSWLRIPVSFQEFGADRFVSAYFIPGPPLRRS